MRLIIKANLKCLDFRLIYREKTIRGIAAALMEDSLEDAETESFPPEGLPLTDEEAAKWGVEMKSEKFAFEVGEEVKVVDGSMSGHKGVVNSIDHEAKIATITLDMFGRKVEAEVALSSVVPLN